MKYTKYFTEENAILVFQGRVHCNKSIQSLQKQLLSKHLQFVYGEKYKSLYTETDNLHKKMQKKYVYSITNLITLNFFYQN